MSKYTKSERAGKAVHHSINPHKDRIIELYKQGLGTRPIAKEIGNGHTHTGVYKALIRWGVKESKETRPQWNKGKRFTKSRGGVNDIIAPEIIIAHKTIMDHYMEETKAAKVADKAWAIHWRREQSRISAVASYHRTKHLPERRAAWRERDRKRKLDPGFREKANMIRAKWKQDPLIRLRCNIGVRMAIAVRGIVNGKKCKSITKLVGCTMQELKNHIERQFTKRMTWDNYGTYWHCDHITPVSYFDLSRPEEQARCSHFTNLRPLRAVDNLVRGNRVGLIQAGLGI